MQHSVIGSQQQLLTLPVGSGAISFPAAARRDLRSLSALPAELGLNAFKDKIAFSYYFANYRWAQLWRAMLRLEPAHGIDYDGSLAMAMQYMAKEYGDVRLRAEATELYVKVLAAVKDGLEGDSREDVARLATTVGVLGMYNVSKPCPKKPSSFVNIRRQKYVIEAHNKFPHQYGIHKIMTFCGPVIWQTEPYLSLYRVNRGILVRLVARIPLHWFHDTD
jgi:hypothetical protein